LSQLHVVVRDQGYKADADERAAVSNLLRPPFTLFILIIDRKAEWVKSRPLASFMSMQYASIFGGWLMTLWSKNGDRCLTVDGLLV